jgi:hypothetical protein
VIAVAAREGGLWGGALPEIYKGNKKIYSFKCVKFFIKDWLIYLFYVNNINVAYAKVVDSNLTLSAISFILFILLFGEGGQLWSSRSRILYQWNAASSCVAMTTSSFTRPFVAGKVGAQRS